MQEVGQELRDDANRTRLPNQLATTDPLIAEMIRSLAKAAQAGALDLYTATAAPFIAIRVILRHGASRRPAPALVASTRSDGLTRRPGPTWLICSNPGSSRTPC